jgi:hypothetical protein
VPRRPSRPLGTLGFLIAAHVHSFSPLPVGLLQVRARLRMPCFPLVGQHPGREFSTISCGWLTWPHPLRFLGENAGRDAFVCSAAVIGSQMKSASPPDAHCARNCAHGDHTRPHQTHLRPKERDSLNS